MFNLLNKLNQEISKIWYKNLTPVVAPPRLELHINDFVLRTNQVLPFSDMKNLMDVVNIQQLMYNPDLDVAVHQINENGPNRVIRLKAIQNDTKNQFSDI